MNIKTRRFVVRANNHVEHWLRIAARTALLATVSLLVVAAVTRMVDKATRYGYMHGYVIVHMTPEWR